MTPSQEGQGLVFSSTISSLLEDPRLCRSDLPWPSTLPPILARGRDLGDGARPPAFRAELARHPAFRAEYALQQRRHIEIGVQAGPVQAEAGRADFDIGQIVGRG